MDTVDFVLTLLAALILSNIGIAVLAWRYRKNAKVAQREIVRLVAQRRTRVEDLIGLRDLTSPPDPQASAQ